MKEDGIKPSDPLNPFMFNGEIGTFEECYNKLVREQKLNP
jgi:hypothetical protein